MGNEKNEYAHIFDIDDTLVGRGLPVRLGALAVGLLRQRTSPPVKLAEIAQMDIQHKSVETPISSLAEMISLWFHSKRKVLPGVYEGLHALRDDGWHIYGSTGRSNKRSWVDMTTETLREGGVLELFADIFYTPDGVRTAFSKAHVLQQLIQQYDHVQFDEDDPRTAMVLAGLFQDVQINLVHYGTTGLLVAHSELERFPNLRRVAVIGNEHK